MLENRRLDPNDFAHCAELLRVGSKSFRAASLLLPPKVRERATVIYAFCRVADDFVDADPDATRSTVDALRYRLRLAYEGRPIDDPVDRSLAAVLADTGIPSAIPEALLEGMEWDAVGRQYETLEDLHAYAARVAGTVGVMMTLAMDVRGDEVLARACDLGVAMQLTNVARDVGEDARRGRVYLPAAWLREAGIETIDAPSPALASVVQRLLAEAESLYIRADHGVPLLPPECRMAIRAARLLYSEIGSEIARRGFDSFSQRAIVSTPRKLWLLGCSTAARYRSAAVLGAPPLAATRELVDACAR